MLKTSIHILLTAVLALATIASATAMRPRARLLVQTDWLAAHLNDSDVVVLHVGPNRTSFDAGHIPGARFLPLADIAVSRNGIPNQLPATEALKAAFERAGVGDKSRVVLYGDMSGLFAARAYFALDYLGHGNRAALLDGGFERWTKERRAVSLTVAANEPGSLTVHARPVLIADLPAMKKILADKDSILIDARPPDEYSGSKPGDGVKRAGHIPGAKNVFWMDNLVNKENPVLKSLPEMRQKYEAVGVKRGKKLVVYCRTNVQASHDYFTLKLLGFDPVLYEGSFFEWSNAPGTPVETSAVLR